MPQGTKRSTWTSAEAPHVIVAGAGVAGLCTAYLLESAGLRCTVLEAEATHIGGRVRTVHLGDGVYGEAGAMRIPEKHRLVAKYIAEFGLETRPFVNSHPNAYFYMRGQRERRMRPDLIRAGYELRPWERDQEFIDLWLAAVQPIIEALSDQERDDLLHSNAWRTRKIHDLDQLPLHHVLEQAGLSPAAIELIAIGEGLGEPLLGSSFVEHLREEVEAVWSAGFLEIVGGMERLPMSFAHRLRDQLRQGAEIIRLEQDVGRNRVAAIIQSSGGEERIEGDYLVCTIPFPVLQRIETSPAFTAGKQRAIRQIHYEAATKVLFKTRRRFWETDDAILGGSSHTDLLTGPIYYPSDNCADHSEVRARGPGVMIASYNWGEAARRLGGLPRNEALQLARRLVGKVHPQLLAEADLIEREVFVPWHLHKWSGGAFAFYQPGQFARLHRDVIAPEGNIHFAGEHASRAHTWIEGALESAERVAREIKERAGLN